MVGAIMRITMMLVVALPVLPASAGGRNDSCTVHTENPFPPGAELTCLFEIAEPGSAAMAQLSITTFHDTGLGFSHVTDRGSTPLLK